MKKNILAIFVIFAVFGAGLGMGFYHGKLQTLYSYQRNIGELEVPSPLSPEEFSFYPSIFWEAWQSLFYQNPPRITLNSPEELDFSLFWEAWQILEKSYFDPEKIDYRQMTYGAIRGMAEALQDPYTVFMEKEELRLFEEDAAGKFSGIGIEMGIRENQIVVIAPLEGTPAERAGLKAGDKIVKIDDRTTRNMSIDVAATLIRGPRGSRVTLTIARENWPEPKEFTIARDVIEIPSLKLEFLEADIAYIKIYSFTRTSSSDFDIVAKDILASPSKKIILDLRNNTGGYLDESQKVAGWFFEKNDTVAIQEVVPGEKGDIYRARGNSKLLRYPMVVLVNRGSASASEILAGALRDNRGIKLIGETTFGKGSIQELIFLKEGGLKVTTARWLTPAGHIINEVGLEPDIIVELTDEDIKADRDPQLDKALELLKEMR